MNEAKHFQELRAIGYAYASMMKLSDLENTMHELAEAFCNGELSDAEYQAKEEEMTERVKDAFGGQLPKGFFINADARGYALKCEGNDKISYRDFGGYQILAPEFEEEA